MIAVFDTILFYTRPVQYFYVREVFEIEMVSLLCFVLERKLSYGCNEFSVPFRQCLYNSIPRFINSSSGTFKDNTSDRNLGRGKRDFLLGKIKHVCHEHVAKSLGSFFFPFKISWKGVSKLIPIVFVVIVAFKSFVRLCL